MHLFLLFWFRGIQKKIAIHFKVLPQDHFGPTLTVASNILQPEAQFGPNNTSARCLLQPEILQPGNTSARNNFAQYTLAPGPNFQKCHF